MARLCANRSGVGRTFYVVGNGGRERAAAIFWAASVVMVGGCASSGARAPATELGVAGIAAAPATAGPATMTVHYIDVGQGAAALLEFPCGAMLIDAGAQDDQHADHLIQYLRDFFARRTDLNNTLDSVVISHQHKDHTYALQRVVEEFNVERMIENGVDHGSGIRPVKWVRQQARRRGIKVVKIDDDQITRPGLSSGLTNGDIDPFACTPVDPKVVVLSGRIDENPGWSDGDFDDGNNQSLVMRIDFNDASFLFTGDLEEAAIDTLVEYYKDTSTLDVDVYHVGHHGSYNGTTEGLLAAMTPQAAVMSVGEWDFGRGQPRGFNTFSFGHPRKVVVDLLAGKVSGSRSPAKSARVFTKARQDDPETVNVQKAIYATGWDGDVRITAKPDGTMTFATSN